MSCGVGCRHDSDPVILWLWCRPKATALIGLLPWKLPYATGAGLKRQKDPKKKKKKKKKGIGSLSPPVKQDKEMKGIQIGKEVKLLLFVHDMIQFIVNPRKNQLDLINEFGKVTVKN